MTKSWRWVVLSVVLAAHDRQIAEHGGLDGIRDQGAPESALARPQQRAAYSQADAADLAASYAWGLARNHAFADGNKRIAWIAARLFLLDNGERLQFERADAISLIERVAAGVIDEAALAQWFRERME